MLKKTHTLENRLHSVKNFIYSLTKSTFVQVFLASCFIAICAQIKIPLYFTPVPFSVQGLGVLLVASVLGGKKGALATLCYLAQGVMGLPVWAGGSIGGFSYLMGPTGGYLIGYVLQAYLVGSFIEKRTSSSLVKLMIIMLSTVVLHLTCGSLWLAQFVGLNKCLILGFFPFVLGDATKAFLVTTYVKYKKR